MTPDPVEYVSYVLIPEGPTNVSASVSGFAGSIQVGVIQKSPLSPSVVETGRQPNPVEEVLVGRIQPVSDLNVAHSPNTIDSISLDRSPLAPGLPTLGVEYDPIPEVDDLIVLTSPKPPDFSVTYSPNPADVSVNYQPNRPSYIIGLTASPEAVSEVSTGLLANPVSEITVVRAPNEVDNFIIITAPSRPQDVDSSVMLLSMPRNVRAVRLTVPEAVSEVDTNLIYEPSIPVVQYTPNSPSVVEVLKSASGTSTPVIEYTPNAPSEFTAISDDEDGDGVADSEDYFYYDPNYKMSKEDLDAYLLDPHGTIEVGDIIRVLKEFTVYADNSYTVNVGDYHIVTEVVDQTRIKFHFNDVTNTISQRGERWELVHPTYLVTPDPNADTDSDGVINSEDYFYTNPNYTMSEAVLDTYEVDSEKAFEVGDVVKLLQPYVAQYTPYRIVIEGYAIVTSISGDLLTLESKKGISFERSTGNRGITIELVTPPNTDIDGDGVLNDVDYFYDNASYTMTKEVLDSYLHDQFKVLAVGDIIKWLVTDEGIFVTGEYYLISNVTGTIEATYEGNTYTLNESDRHVKWMVVNPSDKLTPDPTDSDDDGELDAIEYFDFQSDFTMNQATLDTYVNDRWKSLALDMTGSIIKIIQPVTVDGLSDPIPAGTYLTGRLIDEESFNYGYGEIGINVEDSGGVITSKLEAKGRNVDWIVVNPSDSLTPQPLGLPDFETDALLQHFDFSLAESLTFEGENVSRVEELSKTIQNSELIVSGEDWDFIQNNTTEQPAYTPSFINGLGALDFASMKANMQAKDLISTRFASGDSIPADARFELIPEIGSGAYLSDGRDPENLDNVERIYKIDQGEEWDGYYEMTSTTLSHYEGGNSIPATGGNYDFWIRKYLLNGITDEDRDYKVGRRTIQEGDTVSNRFGVFKGTSSTLLSGSISGDLTMPHHIQNLEGATGSWYVSYGSFVSEITPTGISIENAGEAVSTISIEDMPRLTDPLSDGRTPLELDAKEWLIRLDSDQDWAGYYEMTDLVANEFNQGDIGDIPNDLGIFDFWQRKYLLDGTLDSANSYVVSRRAERPSDFIQYFGVYASSNTSIEPPLSQLDPLYEERLEMDMAHPLFVSYIIGFSNWYYAATITHTIEQQYIKIDDGNDYSGYYEPTYKAAKFFNEGVLESGVWYRRRYLLDFSSSKNSGQYSIVKEYMDGGELLFDPEQTCSMYITNSEAPSSTPEKLFENAGDGDVCALTTPATVAQLITPVDETTTYILTWGAGFSADPYKFEILMVARHNSNSLTETNHYFDSGGIEDAPASSTNPKHRISVRSSSSNAKIQVLTRDNVSGFTTTYRMSGVTELQPQETFILNFKSGAQSRIRVNGGTRELGGSINPVATLDHINIGNWFQDSRGINGWVGEFVIVYRHLSANELNNIEGYLAAKWGIPDKLPISHPGYSHAPLVTKTVELSSTVDMEMIWVEPGTFTMGSPEDDTGWSPQHEVTLTKGFYLGKYEVTQAQYEVVMAGNTDGLSTRPSYHMYGPDLPVEKVSYIDILKFLTRLNEQQAGSLPLGWAYVLPTEAEWEYACRAGTSTEYSWGAGVNGYDEPLASYKPAVSRPTDVGSYSANPWGFFDMHGNVWEMTADAWGYISSVPQTDPFNEGSWGDRRVPRGGSWDDYASNMASYHRYNTGIDDSTRSSDVGFRVLLKQVSEPLDIEMIYVEPGTYTQGSPEDEYPTLRNNAEVQRQVTITKGFYLGKYEVTQTLWEEVMTGNTDGISATPSVFGGNPNRPVENVSWNDVQVFLARLNEQKSDMIPSGWEFKLPSAAEWEYACRAGTTTAFSWGDTINTSNANYDWDINDATGETVDVGSYAPNPWGFYDMHGNVSELTNSVHLDYDETAVTDPDPQDDGANFFGGTSEYPREARGGSHGGRYYTLRSAQRGHLGLQQDYKWDSIGFRLALKRVS